MNGTASLAKLLTLLACLAAPSACGAQAGSTPTAHEAQRFPRPARAAVLVLENRSYEQVIGSARAPYLNRLGRHNALATRYYAIAHPSLPNYIALTGGSEFGIKNDCSLCAVDGRNIVGQLDSAGRTWKAYFEELDSSRRPGPVTAEYNPHYNPFVYYETVRGADSNRDRVVGFADLRKDLQRGRLAN